MFDDLSKEIKPADVEQMMMENFVGEKIEVSSIFNKFKY